jgi:general secretion pathway protein N
MIAAFQRRPLAVSLAAVAVVLAVIIAIELGVGGGLRSALAPSAPKRTVSAEAKLLPPMAPLAPEQAYPETTARPLFLPTRRPAPEAPVDKKTLVPGQFVLQGVTVAGNTRIALLREKANGRIHRVERGREVNGIQVIEIQPEVVTLGQGGEREVLSLQVQKPTGTPAAPAQAGPFGTTPAVPPPLPTSPSGMPMPAGAPTPPPPQQPQAAPVPPRTGAFPSAPTPPPPGTAPANPVAREQEPPMTPEELLARRRARRNQQAQ